MWKKLAMITAAAATLSLAVAVGADARSVGLKANADAGVGAAGVHARTHAGLNARASARGPRFTHPGW